MANDGAFSLSGGDPIGASFDTAFALDFRGATGLMQGEIFSTLWPTGNTGIEALAPRSRGGKGVLVSAAPLVVGEGKIAGVVVTLVDLSGRKAAIG